MSHEQKHIIYVKILNRLESIEINSRTSSEDLRGWYQLNSISIFWSGLSRLFTQESFKVKNNKIMIILYFFQFIVVLDI
jgi:hypothetical protein